jgi:hypothetical protein
MNVTFSVWRWVKTKVAGGATLALVLVGSAQPLSAEEPHRLTVPDRVDRIRAALNERHETGQLGRDIIDSGRAEVSQWRDWRNWRNWRNWPNWGNWGNWRNF